MHKIYLGLGANIGNKKETISKAIKRIEELIGVVERQSALYETAPWGFKSENTFLNGAILCNTILSPQQLLLATQQIERELGRKEKSVNGSYTDRIIDIDILLYDDITIDEDNLKIPHPLMKERDFVVKSRKEIME